MKDTIIARMPMIIRVFERSFVLLVLGKFRSLTNSIGNDIFQSFFDSSIVRGLQTLLFGYGFDNGWRAF
jgi:hypothetical protein